MSLIAILVSLLIEHGYDQVGHWRRYDKFHDYAGWMRARLRQDWVLGYVELILVLLPLALAVLLLQSIVDDALFGLLELVFAVVVLVVCLGPKDMRAQILEYKRVLEAGDEQQSRHQAQQWMTTIPADENEQHGAVLGKVFVAANERIFGVMVWFLILGPLGAVLYRAIKELAVQPVEGDIAFNAALDRGEWLMDWLPARIMVIGFALTGHFDNVLRAWRNNIHEAGWGGNAAELLDATGKGALDVALPDDWAPVFGAAADLLRRTLIVWLFILALLTIAGWLS